jgi:alpha-beta hydrolase superfamily lysophospholipase
MVQNDTWFECDDGTKLYLRRLPAGGEKPRAVAHIVHGMSEHAGRYARFAQRLADCGIEVWAADQRGHGKTADISINQPGAGGLTGHCADTDGFSRVCADIHLINRAIREAHPGIPLFLLGHSWGSFIVQNYIEIYNDEAAGFAGCILSGTRGPGGFKIRVGVLLMSLLAFFCGQRRGSRLARALAGGAYNRPFKPCRTPCDWLSRDEAEIDAYLGDPLRVNICSSGFYRDMLKWLYRIHRPQAMSRISRELPLYVFSGSADPVGEMGARPTALVGAYRAIGVRELEFVLYPGARHELLNETNRDEVSGNLIAWMNRRLSAIEQGVLGDSEAD